MAERYSRLFALPQNLYVEGSPVIIAAGALLKDNQSGRVLAQLKFRSITDNRINALKVLVIGYDMSGEEVCSEEHQYLDLNISRDAVWGTKEAIPFSDRSARSFSAQILAVYFADGSRYFADDTYPEPLPRLKPLSTRLSDGELIRQYQLDSTQKSEFVPETFKDLWLCSCGGINRGGEDCHLCGKSFEELTELLSVERLREDKNERLKEAAREEAEHEAMREGKMRSVKKLLLILVPVLIAVGLAGFFLMRANTRENDYNTASALFYSEKYSEAQEAFEKLGDYKDSQQFAAQAKAHVNTQYEYEKAKKLLENGRYDDARDGFAALGDYLDSADYAKEALYRKAKSLADGGQFPEAKSIFEELGDYKDARTVISKYVLKLVSETCSDDRELGLALTTEYSYDGSGRLASATRRLSEYQGKKDEVSEYAYNDDGSYTVTTNGTVKGYDAYGVLVSENGEALFEPDYGYYEDGSIFYCAEYSLDDGLFMAQTVFDEQGNTIELPDGSTAKNEYDGNGRLAKRELTAADGSFIERVSFEYGDDGLLKSSMRMDDGESFAATEYRYEYVYLPDAG